MNVEEILVKLGIDVSPVKRGLAEAGRDVDEFGGKSKFLGLHLGELKKLTRELGHEFPLAGEAARLMLNPIAGTFTAAIAIFGYAKNYLEEWNKEMDRSAEVAAKPDFLEALNARKKALEDVQIKSALFTDSLLHQADAEKRYNTAVRNSIDLLHEMVSAQNALADAQLGFDTEELKHRLDVGLLTEQQYYTALATLERKHAEEKLKREKDAHKAEITAKEGELAHAQSQKGTLEAKARQDEQAALAARQGVIMKEGTLTGLPEQIKEQDKLIAAKEQELKSGGGIDYVRSMAKSRLTDPLGIYKRKADEYQALLDRGKQLTDTKQKLETELPEARLNAAMTEAAAARSQGKIGKNEERLETLPEEIAQLRRTFGIQEATGAGMATIANARNALRTQGTTPTFDESMELQQRRDHPGNYSIYGTGQHAQAQQSLDILTRMHQAMQQGGFPVRITGDIPNGE